MLIDTVVTHAIVDVGVAVVAVVADESNPVDEAVGDFVGIKQGSGGGDLFPQNRIILNTVQRELINVTRVPVVVVGVEVRVRVSVP